MGFFVQKDGRTSNTQKIDAKFRAQTYSTTSQEDRQQNIDGNVWSVTVEQTPAGVDDFITYILNTGSTSLHFTDARTKSSVIGDLTLHKVLGTPIYVSETALVGVNRNLGSNNPIGATINRDANITGLIDGGEVFFQRLDTADKVDHLRTSSNIIITPGTAIAIKISTVGAVKTTLSFVEVDHSITQV